MSYTRTITSNGNSISQDGGQSFNQQLDALEEQIGEGGGAPDGTGFVKVTSGVYDTPGPLSADDINEAMDAASADDGQVWTADGAGGGSWEDVSATDTPSVVQCSKSGDQGLTTGSDNWITFETNNYQTDSGMHDTSSNKSRFVAKVAGPHTFRFSLVILAASVGSIGYRVRKNGTTETVFKTFNGLGNAVAIISDFWTENMAVNDYLEVSIKPVSSGASNCYGSTELVSTASLTKE